MIHLIIDIYEMINIERSEESLCVKGYTDYIRARKQIREALTKKRDLLIHIIDPVCSKWFWDLKAYPEMEIEEHDPCRKLREKFGFDSLPKEVLEDPEFIIRLNLISKPVPKEHPKNVTNWILNETLGKCWGERIPSWLHLASLMNWFLQGLDERGANEKILGEWKENRVKKWLSENKRDIHFAYEWFFKEPKSRAKIVCAAQILKDYPEKLRKEWISKIVPECELPSYELITSLPFLWQDQNIIQKISEDVQLYWQGEFQKEEVNFQELLNGMSGKIIGELEAVYEWLKKNPEKCSIREIDMIQSKFDILEETRNYCDDLVTLIPPKYPCTPDPKWTWDKWSHWILTEYFPYRFWLWRSKKTDTKVDEFSCLFSDWLYKNYPKFIHKLEPLVYGTFYRIKNLIKQGYTVLWILIDNLTWNLSEDLLKMLQAQKINLVEEIFPQIAMLPSETHISKRAILTGQIPSQIQEKTPDVLFRECVSKLGINARREVNTKNLKQLFSQPAHLYLYQYDKLDSLAHESEYKIVDRTSSIQEALSWLVKQIIKEVKELPNIHKLRIVISTDHGSTYIAKSGRNLEIPPSAEEDETSKRHKRFIRIAEKKELNEREWYFLKSQDFGLKNDYVVTKGYFYLTSRPQGYTHGGLTPEEAVVPYLELQAEEQPELKPLDIVYRGKEILRGRPQELTFIIKNSNTFNITNFSLRLPEHMLEIRMPSDKSIKQRSEGETEKFSITLEPKMPVKAGYCILYGVCSYKAFGMLRTQKIEIKIGVRQIYKTSEEIEDLL